ncbi:MAG TPA: serine/threonine-protein kinase [Pyrinomonadaceae bacterium]|nr:serine/threonine-protein kinase [Pyrinomonadaceae bacterium]
MIEAGKVLQNRYRVDRQVGQGGMGAVYIATDERFGSTVAIKETLFTDEKFRKAFEREARLLNSLRHPALPRVSDHFIEGNGQFLVMEYIDGEDLSEQIENEGHAFPVKDVMSWALQLLDALDYLHSQAMPVIHRDIKPQNLKLTPEGQVVLLDFGLAKGNTTNPDSATAAKSVFGYSRNYASLEQIQGTGTDPRSDLYSLAATLYHLIAGNPPVDALTRAMNVLSEKSDPSVPLRQARPDVPQGISNVLEKAMSLNANQRPGSATEMKAMLEAAVAGEDLSTWAAATYVERADTSVGRDLHTQKTELKSEFGVPAKQSEIKTETFSNEMSKVTRLRSEAETGSFRPDLPANLPATAPKRRALAAGAAALLLFLAGAGTLAYFFMSQRSAPMANSTVTQPASNVAAVPATNSNSNSQEFASNSNATEQPIAGTTPTPGSSKSETTKTETKTLAEKTPNASDDVRTETPSVPAVPDPKNDPRTAVGDPRMPPNANSGLPSRDPRTRQQAIPPDVWRKMSPEQRRKLRRALELQKKMEDSNRQRDPDDN